MLPEQIDSLESFRTAAPEDQCAIVFSTEIAARTARDEEKRRSLRKLLDIMWPEYLDGAER